MGQMTWEDFLIEGEQEKACVVCGKLTRKVEICFEATVCSVECSHTLSNEYNEALEKGVYSMKICSVEGCNETGHAKGFCNNHYWRFRYYGDPLGVSRRKYKYKDDNILCTHEGCTKQATSNMLCTNHDMQRKYREYRRLGLCVMCAKHTGLKTSYCIDCKAVRAAYKREVTRLRNEE